MHTTCDTPKLLKEGDLFQNLEVTRVSDTYCFFGKKRMSWGTIEKLTSSGEKIFFRFSPNKVVDWTDKENVVEYHNCFNRWNTYISGHCNRFQIHKGILEVKDGLVFFEGEYFLPCPVPKWEGKESFWNAKQENLKNGLFNVTLLKQENDWYPKEDVKLRKNITLNLFMLGVEVKRSVKELKPNSEELWASQYDDGINFNYHHSTWDGISFGLSSIDTVKLFRKYYVQQRWSSDNNIDITDAEISKLLYPIEMKLSDILRDALSNRKIHIDIDESYGEASVSNMLQFEKSIAKQIFDLINETISK